MWNAVDAYSGRLLKAQQAHGRHRGGYRCPRCHLDVYLRDGSLRDAHFAHYSGLDAQRCELFHSVPSGGVSGMHPARLTHIADRPVLEFWQPGEGWVRSPGRRDPTAEPLFFDRTQPGHNLPALFDDEEMFQGRSYLALLPSSVAIPEALQAQAQFVVEAWTAWNVVIPRDPAQNIRAWFRAMGHTVRPPSFSVRGLSPAARSEETEGVLSVQVGQSFLVACRPTGASLQGSARLTWRFQRQGDDPISFLANEQSLRETSALHVRLWKPGTWSIQPMTGGTIPLWVEVSPAACRRFPSSPVEASNAAEVAASLR